MVYICVTSTAIAFSSAKYIIIYILQLSVQLLHPLAKFILNARVELTQI